MHLEKIDVFCECLKTLTFIGCPGNLRRQLVGRIIAITMMQRRQVSMIQWRKMKAVCIFSKVSRYVMY